MTHDPVSTWYDDFFTELPNTFWRAAVPPEATDAEIDFLVRTVGLQPGDSVLDVCCGSGRHALELARRGYRVTGIDVSAEAIAYARQTAADEGLAVDLRVGDMRALPTDVQADLAICMGNAFGYLEHEGTQAFLADLVEDRPARRRPGSGLRLRRRVDAARRRARGGADDDRRGRGDVGQHLRRRRRAGGSPR